MTLLRIVPDAELAEFATVSPEGGPVPCPPGETPLFYAKHVGGGDIIFCTAHPTAPDPVADGWHPFALLPDKP